MDQKAVDPSSLPGDTVESQRAGSRGVLAVGLLSVLVGGLAARVLELPRLPGVNGDEAWFGAQVMGFLQGSAPVLSTPTGNPLNPFHTGVLLLLHAAGVSPSVLVLRLPALLANLALLALAYPLLRRSIGRRGAVLATLGLASLPVLIAYSRLGWDPSQVPLASLITMHFALRGRLVPTVLAQVAAVLIHPTSIFIGPVILGVWAPRLCSPRPEQSKPSRWKLLLLIALGMALALLACEVLGWRWLDVRPLAARMVQLPVLAARFVELLSGVTVYRCVSGEPTLGLVALSNGLVTALLLAAWGVGGRALWRDRRFAVIGGALGTLGSVFLLFAIGGTQPFEPHHERYAMVFVVPTVVLSAAAFDAGWRHLPSTRLFATSITISLVLLAGTAIGLFAPLLRTGGDSHRTYWTGPVEPKRAALDEVEVRLMPGEVGTIMADDWWTYWPLTYLASKSASIQVEMAGGNPLRRARELEAEGRRPFAVGFPAGRLDMTLGKGAAVHPGVIRSNGGRPALLVWDLKGCSGRRGNGTLDQIDPPEAAF